jgi:hypothetical protein
MDICCLIVATDKDYLKEKRGVMENKKRARITSGPFLSFFNRTYIIFSIIRCKNTEKLGIVCEDTGCRRVVSWRQASVVPSAALITVTLTSTIMSVASTQPPYGDSKAAAC